MEDSTSFLVVTPHPDDAEGGAGGTIARWTAEGRKGVLVLCTNGDKGTSDRNISPASLAKIREKEQRHAAEAMGISEVVCLGFPDQGLEDCSEFREKLVRQIRIHKPQTVMTVDPARPYIRHRDHYMCGRVTLDAVFPYARDHLAYPEHLEEGLEPHKVSEVYLFRSDTPDTFLDITDTFDAKMEALYRHVSQMGSPREEREARSRARHAEAGKKIGVALAEEFKRIELWR
ncbi:MAG: PIG-L family deacetylase [Chloroflexi bacterium]|nr:PIG-L family deacetylase [Chloroflexota bacterium]